MRGKIIFLFKRLKNSGELQLQKAQLKSILEYPKKFEKDRTSLVFNGYLGKKNADF